MLSRKKAKSNRDVARQNMASSLVKATMYSNLVNEGLKCISDLSKDELTKDTNMSDSCKRKLETIVSVTDTCITTNSTACKKYQKCSTYVKRGSVDIANKETNLIKKAIECGENPSLIKSIHHYEDNMGSICTLLNRSRNSKCHTSMMTHAQDRMPSTSTDLEVPGSELSSSFPVLTIPSPSPNALYHTPLEAIRIVQTYTTHTKRHCPQLPPDCKGSHDRKVTKSLLMQYMIKEGHVPIKSTAFRKIMSTAERKGRLEVNTWTEITSPGRKPHLPSPSINKLIEKWQESTEGGKVMDKSSVAASVEKHIKTTWSDNNDARYENDTIPRSTMRRYMQRIMSHPSFNIQKSVSNKTESRSVAEWSVRSTISYLCVVLATHFIRAEPTKFHPKKNQLDLEVAEIWTLIEELNNKVLDINTINSHVEKSIPVLPNLITSTDETTLFITSQLIKNAEVWYLCAKPKEGCNPMDSGRRDNYTTNLSGDAHCRGLRITMNNTFTAGGRCAPAFVCVYGLSAEEMPGDDIVVVPIEGLVASSNLNGSMQKGFMVFIRGKYDPKDEGVNTKENDHETNSNDMDTEEDSHAAGNDTHPVDPSHTLPNDTRPSVDPSPNSEDDRSASKEARVAKLYRDLVYYPFIKDIRVQNYNMSSAEDAEVPDNLTAVCWMDGCYGQLNLITRENVLDNEKLLKIICNKHSAARTAVEQAADVGPMFKVIKHLLRYMTNLKSCQSPIYQRILDALNDLTSPNVADPGRVLILPSHKKKAIISALSKLPAAMGAAFTPNNIISAFEDNGQIDREERVVPNVQAIVNTYRGSIDENHYLNDPSAVIKTFYSDVYMNGRIQEAAFDKEGVITDIDSNGTHVNRDFGIIKENCQRAKVLSAKVQRNERIALVKTMRVLEYDTKVKLYTTEDKKYEQNKLCEGRILKSFQIQKTVANKETETDRLNATNSEQFADIIQDLTKDHFGMDTCKGNAIKKRPTINQLIAFAQVRQPIPKFKGRSPLYKSMGKDRNKIIAECFRLKDIPIYKRIFAYPEPINDPTEVTNSV